MEGYGGDGGSQRVSQGEWSQNFEWMQEMTASFFRPHCSISEMLQRPSLLPSSFSAFPPPPPLRIHPYVIHPPHPLLKLEILKARKK
jgi:hypothetical protein